MKRNILTLGVVCALSLFAGCAKQAPVVVAETKKTPVAEYFDAAVRGHAPYVLPGITGYDLRAYEIVQQDASFASVRLTLASQAGTDLVKTKRFNIDKEGRLHAVEREDIRDGIANNLTLVAMAAKHSLRINGQPMSWKLIVDQGKLNPATLESFDGEDYSQVKIEPDGQQGYEVSLNDSTGAIVAARVP